ncbi:MAG: hypothetical protein CR997_04760 [Acidobacteria bacterium]|nr:MAG: hypothetical protein CR997_04760 [Acidobacteriota bacterium]
MKAYMATLGEVQQWMIHLSEKMPLFFPQKSGEVNYQYKLVEKMEDIQFKHYKPTIIPPVKKLLPAEEELLRYDTKENGEIDVQPILDKQPRILAGVRPCDIKSIFLMDEVFSDGEADPYYLTRRERTSIIGYACKSPCDNMSFCESVDSLYHTEGADIMIYMIDGEFLVEELTEKGKNMLNGADFVEIHDAAAKKVGFQVKRPEPFGRQFKAPVGSLPETVKTHWKSPVWDKHVATCFSCGTCNLVCPTCYCFDVKDDINLDVKSGNRTRSWDACMVPGFAEVAGGHNFRPKPAARQRHRVKRKFEYLPMRYGHGSSCIGCGRCGRQCTSGIDIFDIVQDLIAEGVTV